MEGPSVVSVRMWWFTAALCAIVIGVPPGSHLPVAVAAPATTQRFVIVPEESQVAYRGARRAVRGGTRDRRPHHGEPQGPRRGKVGDLHHGAETAGTTADRDGREQGADDRLWI